MIRFIVDTQLPETVARWLRGRGVDAVHVLERNLGQSDDSVLWTVSIEEHRVMISKDEDFFILASRPSDTGRLLWIRIGNCRTSELLTIFNHRWAEIVAAFEGGQRIVELR